MNGGRVEGIFIAAWKHAPPQPVERVRAYAGKGLEGNRYFYEQAPPGKALTLIAAEAIEGMAAEHGIEITPAESRRNVVTRGIRLAELIGQRFRLGEVVCEGVRICDSGT